MRRKRDRRPQLETLESMTLLSGIAAGLHHLAAVDIAGLTSRPATPTKISLNGVLTGTYHVKSPNPDVGANDTFFGHGKIRPLGTADVTGHAHSLGNVATGKARGLLVISTPQGSLTLRLEGPNQKGLAPLPDRFRFKITNASGSYLKDRGHGTVVLVLDPAKAGADHGTFTMVFDS
jgi:hypothetical protein